MKLEGMNAIVTGAASGMGAETAKAIAAAGATVGLVDLPSPVLDEMAAVTNGTALPFDVTDASAAESAIGKFQENGQPLRIAVNCAGIAPAKRIVGRDGACPLDDFAAVINVNLIGTFNVMRLTATQMLGNEPDLEGERGVIINTASIAAYEGQIGQAAYAASKGGVAALTLPAAREFAAKGVRIMAIAPGLFGTPMVLTMPQDVQDSISAKVPFPNRFGRPEEFADLTMQIISNRMLNGSVIRLDGALRMEAR